MDTYWNSKGKFQSAADTLQKLIPDMGPVPKATTRNKKLEKFRKAANCYYDLYNNGLCNRRRSFVKIFTSVPAWSLPRYGETGSARVYEAVEREMDEIIRQAAEEQEILL